MTKVLFRKKTYNQLADSGDGVIVFDNGTNKIYVGGDCYSSDVKDATWNANTKVLTIIKSDSSTISLDFSGYEQLTNKVTLISSSSTDTQYPTAKCVYDKIAAIRDNVGLSADLRYYPTADLIANEDNIQAALDLLSDYMSDYILQVTAYANNLIEQGVVTPIPYVPSLLYAPEVITDTTSTSVTLNPVKGNAVYVFTQPLTELNILSVSGVNLETTIYFTTDSTVQFSYEFPQGMYKGTVIKFDKDCHYCMSIKDGLVILEKIEKYLNESTFIFSSEQLMDGYLKSSPDVVEISGTTPIIATTQPYTIYKLSEITSLTMQQIPANTLETIVYFSAGSTPVNLVLTGTVPLKLSSGSVTNLTNGNFCLVIKDGVVVITEMKEM